MQEEAYFLSPMLLMLFPNDSVKPNVQGVEAIIHSPCDKAASTSPSQSGFLLPFLLLSLTYFLFWLLSDLATIRGISM